VEGREEWGKLNIAALHNFVAFRNVENISVDKYEEKRPLGRPGGSWKGSVKWVLTKYVFCMALLSWLDGSQWRLCGDTRITVGLIGVWNFVNC
jgi:hypothetical protein